MLLSKAFSSGTLPKLQVYLHGEDEFLDAEEAWLHEDAAEEGGQACSDTELIASQRRIIIDIGKQLGRKIMAGNLNLINITLPVIMFEPRSYLQKLSDPWVHPVHLEAAAAACPLERLKLCVTWFVAGLQHVFSSWRKPFNPVIGETWQACLPSGSSICCEQISHHPPVTAFHMEGPRGIFSFDGLSQPDVAFAGGGLKTSARGYRRITFASDGAVVAITYPYYRIGGLLSGVPHGLIKGTATLTDMQHGLAATVTFGPVAGAASRLLNRPDAFEAVITRCCNSAAGVGDVRNVVHDVIVVPDWVQQAVTDAAARRAGCGVHAAAAAAPIGIGSSSSSSAAAATTVSAAVGQHTEEVEQCVSPAETGLTSSSLYSERLYQEFGAATAAAAATGALSVKESKDSILASLASRITGNKLILRRSKSYAHDVKRIKADRAVTWQDLKQQQQHSSKDGNSNSSSSKNGGSLAHFFVRASSSSTALRVGSSSSDTCGRCTSSCSRSDVHALVQLGHLSNSTSSKSMLNADLHNNNTSSSSSSSAKKRINLRCMFQQVFSPIACFTFANPDSDDINAQGGRFGSSNSNSSSGGCVSSSRYEEDSCTATCHPEPRNSHEVAAVAGTEGGSQPDAVNEAANRSSSCSSSSNSTTTATATAAMGGVTRAALTDASDAEVCISSNPVAVANISSSSKPPTQQQQQQVAAACPVQGSGESVGCKQQQQPQACRRLLLGPRVQVVAVGTGCWLAHLDFDGQRYWTLSDDPPEVWQSLPQQQQQQQQGEFLALQECQQQQQQQQEFVLPSDCQNRPDLVALREGDVKLSQHLKEQMEQQQRRDARLRPHFSHVDCTA